MTNERAEEIMANINFLGGGVLGFGAKTPYPKETPEEKQEIMAKWRSMPGWTCYYDAVNRIAKGEADGCKI